MTIKFYTIQNPPPVLAEPESKLPDECRQSDYIPLETLLQRFIATGGQFQQYMTAQSLSAEEKEALFNEPDLEDEDIAVQKAFADDILNKVIKEQEKEPTQPVKQDEPEKKPETATENA